MSNASRGGKRIENDVYSTPQWQVELFLSEFIKVTGIDLGRLTILDPCAGGVKGEQEGPYAAALRKFCGEYGDDIQTWDIRPDAHAKITTDYLTTPIDAHDELNSRYTLRPDMIITNPPFSCAFEIIKKAVTESEKYVIMLLRLNFFATAGRNEWLRNNMPVFCFIHPQRPSFTANGNTDSNEYAHFVWRTDVLSGPYTKTYLMPVQEEHRKKKTHAKNL